MCIRDSRPSSATARAQPVWASRREVQVNWLAATVVAATVMTTGTAGGATSNGPMVRIAEVEVDPAQLDAYKAILAEEQEASVRLEAGVLMLHSTAIADQPTQIRLLEV